jgi:hypothetical protein
MKWRDVIIGAIASLMVTVLGGVAVYYFTQEPKGEKAEKLQYSISQNAKFTGGAQDFSFSSIEVSNAGNLAAQNVEINISSKSAEIRDFAVTVSDGLKEVFREKTDNGLHIKYATLLPKEVVTFNLILSAPESIIVSVRSDDSRGEQVDRNVTTKSPALSNWNRIAELTIPVGSTLAIVAMTASLLLLRRFNRKSSDGHDYDYSSRNNTGFLMLHSGLVDKAESVFSAAIQAGQCDQHTLANYALCKAAQGEFDEANRLISAAEFRPNSGHRKAIILFNQALIFFLNGDKDNFLKTLKESLLYSKSEIVSYSVRSKLLDPIRSDAAFATLITEAQA